MNSWIATSDMDTVVSIGDGRDLAEGCIIAELSASRIGCPVLADATVADARVTLCCSGPDSIEVRMRYGARQARYRLQATSPSGRADARLEFRWNAATGRWSLTLDPATGAAARSGGTGAMPLPVALARALCTARCRAEPVAWVGVVCGPFPDTTSWIGPRTMLDTPHGPRRAGDLVPGDRVHTGDDGPLPLLAIRRRVMPARGSLAPLRLRGAYFRAATDLLVSARQAVALEGTAAEYLFGTSPVLAEARDLVDGTRVLVEERPVMQAWVTLDFGRVALVHSGGCLLAFPSRGAGPACIDAASARAFGAMRQQDAGRTPA